jgi:acyl carrier protein
LINGLAAQKIHLYTTESFVVDSALVKESVGYSKEGAEAMERSQLRAVLAAALEKCVDESVGELSDEQNLREGLKLDSIDLLSTSIEVQNQLNISLNSADFDDLETVGDLLDLLASKTMQERRRAA